MSDLIKNHLDHVKKISWAKGMSVRAANALMGAGFNSRNELVDFIEQGGRLRIINNIGVEIEKEILKWLNDE